MDMHGKNNLLQKGRIRRDPNTVRAMGTPCGNRFGKTTSSLILALVDD